MPGEVWHHMRTARLYKLFDKLNVEVYISSYGRVKQDKKGKATILKQKTNSDKYLYVVIGATKIDITQMVAIAYVANPFDLPERTHINGVKTDNRRDNIQWCASNSDDILQPYITGQYKKIPVISKGTAVVKLGYYRAEHHRLAVYKTIKEAAEANRLPDNKISGACLSGKTHEGFYWMHLRDYLTGNATFIRQAKYITNENKHIWLKVAGE